MAGSLEPETTPGGGLTMVLTLPAAQPPVAASEAQAGTLAERAIVERIHRRPRTGEPAP
jgi:two-component system sensor histidine kinase KdpD